MNHTDDSDPWNYLGFWRIFPQEIQILVNNTNFSIIANRTNHNDQSFTFNDNRYTFKVADKTIHSILIQMKHSAKRLAFVVDQNRQLLISCENHSYRIFLPDRLKSYPDRVQQTVQASLNKSGEIKSPLYGKVLDINVEIGQMIKKGELMVLIEAMKSENRILAPWDAKVLKIAIMPGAQVNDGMTLLFLEEQQ